MTKANIWLCGVIVFLKLGFHDRHYLFLKEEDVSTPPPLHLLSYTSQFLLVML